ncbi:MAG TPA: hypothetical protein VN513_06400 [Gemmatimonadales bacterium]|nr:hypothetical protein [Gemmatimonadales bacterium]
MADYQPMQAPQPPASFTFIAGRLLCGRIRDFLRHAAFADPRIEWIESSGLIQRRFTIRGPSDDVQWLGTELYRRLAGLEVPHDR